MKFWWPHNEAIIATLLAWRLTGEERYARWHRQVHDWSFAHFADPEYGEWFGYLPPRRHTVRALERKYVERPLSPSAHVVVLLAAS